MQNIMIGLVLLFLIGACTMKSDVIDDGKTNFCTDSRDGEKFSFKTSSVKSVMVGMLGAESCFDITDSNGKDRTLCKSQEAFIKCVSRME